MLFNIVINMIFLFSLFPSTTFSHTMSKATKRVVVVGGGAAGYMSAIQCAQLLRSHSLDEKQVDVIILEAGPKPLQKVEISGGGRCNVMHNPYIGNKVISSGYPRGSKELLGPYNKQFGPMDTYKFFSDKTPLKVEADGRVFPETDKSSTIINILLSSAKDGAVRSSCSTNVKEINKLDDNTFHVKYTVKQEEGGKKEVELNCDKLIFATGSSPTGYKMLKSLTHEIVNPVPSLFSFKINDDSLTALAGLSVSDASVDLVILKEFIKENRELVRPHNMKIFNQRGPVLFTHQGLSGPGILKLSAFGARVLKKMNYNFDIKISWIPQVDLNEMIDHLQDTKKRYAKKQIGKAFPPIDLVEEEDWDNYYDSSSSSFELEDVDADVEEMNIKGTLPKRLWQYLLTRSEVPTQKNWAEITNDEIKRIATAVCAFTVNINGRGLYRDEFVTAGGVNLKEVNFKDMQSKLVQGLYLAGECMDIDGITGGYNFQSAWTSGAIAGQACARELLNEFGIEQNENET